MTNWFKKFVTRFVNRMGYSIVKGNLSEMEAPYILFRYTDAKGNFDYDKYVATQTEGNVRKIGKGTWVAKESIDFLSDYLKQTNPNPIFGLCHGTRDGMEQKWFSENLDCEVLGTEIAHTATELPNTIQWDFHEVKGEWIDSADFVYSNSLDHSYDPEKALNAWMCCLKPDGMCILEHAKSVGKGSSETDPFGVQLAVLPYLVLLWGNGKYSVKEIVKVPGEYKIERNFLIITHNDAERFGLQRGSD